MRAPRPTANIMRAIGLDSTVATRSSSGGMEIARCGCGSRLEFGTGSYGQSIEQCTNRRCPNAAPHRPGDYVELSPLRQASHARRRRRNAS